MGDKIQTIYKLLDASVLDKKQYCDLLEKLDIEIDEILESSGYDYSKTRNVNLYNLSIVNRIDDINSKEETFNENNKIAIPESVIYWYGIFNDFLEVYNIGSCREFSLNERGFFDIEISTLIHQPSLDSKKESNKLKFEEQIKRLKAISFELDIKNKSVNLFDSGKNRILIKMLLNKIGARRFSIKITDDFIRSITFSLSPIDLPKLRVHKNDFSFKVSENLNLDELNNLKNICSQLIHATNDMNGNLLHTC